MAKFSMAHGMTWNMLFCFALMTLSVFNYGFDNQIFSSIQAMTPFEKRFGYYDTKTQEWGFTAERLAILNSMGLPAKGTIQLTWPVKLEINKACI